MHLFLDKDVVGASTRHNTAFFTFYKCEEIAERLWPLVRSFGLATLANGKNK
jgi:hypothetical protein